MAIDDKLIAESNAEDQYIDIPINNSAEIALNSFYICCGISPEDYDAKRKIMSGIVHLPNWDYHNEGIPPLAILEDQYLREKGIYH